ncbi:MAG: ABC transporter permease [Methanothrix sp.]|nr:ABC transporter permease [Methanothrix sp.]
MEASGIVVMDKDIPEPGVHQLNDIIQSVLQLLIILTILAVILGTFLVINIVSALLAQQVQQIGAMKAVGARSGGIVSMYLQAMVILGLSALVIFVPLSVLMSRGSSVFVANFINFDISKQLYSFSIIILPISSEKPFMAAPPGSASTSRPLNSSDPQRTSCSGCVPGWIVQQRRVAGPIETTIFSRADAGWPFGSTINGALSSLSEKRVHRRPRRIFSP